MKYLVILGPNDRVVIEAEGYRWDAGEDDSIEIAQQDLILVDDDDSEVFRFAWGPGMGVGPKANIEQ